MMEEQGKKFWWNLDVESEMEKLNLLKIMCSFSLWANIEMCLFVFKV